MVFSATVSLSVQHLLPCVSFPFFYFFSAATHHPVCFFIYEWVFQVQQQCVCGCPKSSNKSFDLDSWVTWRERMEDVVMSPWFVVSLQLARSVQTESCKH